MAVKRNFPRKTDQEVDCRFVLLSELPQELPAQGLQSLHRSCPHHRSSWRIRLHEYTVRNQAAEQEIFSRLCDNGGVSLPVVEQIVLACLGPWALEGVKGCCFLTASKLRKGRVFELLALPAPASRTAIGISRVCLLFVLPFGNCSLASMVLCCAVGTYSLGRLYQAKFISEMFESSKLT